MCNLESGINLIKRELLSKYPIKGGYGKSFEDAIEFDIKAASKFVELEHNLVQFLGVYIHKLYRVNKQHLKKHEDKIYDILTVVEIDSYGEKFVTEIYFNITDCWNIKNKKI